VPRRCDGRVGRGGGGEGEAESWWVPACDGPIMPDRGGARHRDGVHGLVLLRCLKRGCGGRVDEPLVQRSHGGMDAISLWGSLSEGDPALSLTKGPFGHGKFAAGLLEGGRA
jgi:hypothetical protein